MRQSVCVVTAGEPIFCRQMGSEGGWFPFCFFWTMSAYAIERQDGAACFVEDNDVTLCFDGTAVPGARLPGMKTISVSDGLFRGEPVDGSPELFWSVEPSHVLDPPRYAPNIHLVPCERGASPG